LHWLGCWIDECHELFLHPRYGKEAAELAIRLIKRGHKYGISLILATQSPTKDSIPREVTRNVSCGVAFCVGITSPTMACSDPANTAPGCAPPTCGLTKTAARP
jgi:hypothetical protein